MIGNYIASLVAAALHPPAMSGTNSSPNGQFGASLTAAKFTHVFVIMVMSFTMTWICEEECMVIYGHDVDGTTSRMERSQHLIR